MRSLLVKCVLLTASFTPAFTVQPAEAPVLPTVSFYSLSKVRVTLPADLKSDRTLLLLYFRLSQQPDIDSWNAVFSNWRAGDSSLTSYTSLVSPRINILSRWWQNSSLRSATPNTESWSTTLPLYVDKKPFLAALRIDSEKQVVLLLTDRQGHVLNRAIGPPTEQNRTAMHAALEAAGSKQQP